MKKIVIFNLLLLLTVGCSDRSDKPVTYRFEIINESGGDIKIKSYNSAFAPILVKEIKIQDGGLYKENFLSRKSGRSYLFSDVFNADSLKIIYRDRRIASFYCYNIFSNQEEGCDEENNILAVVEDYSSDEDVILRRYTFTTENYENAMPCDGDCE
ncbi:hypothetical protein JM83_0856 [Gillisia sp. Hel_I_86]|uniref:hypothetical protein n=1 Tax=Gillisia sp. Hel_I_86 TaxID=1249981 RepID=UPI001199C2A0|nr:hypothetical protein [Gillisia sp. Hel_I_86]TVZ25915.1 hypothetical protein JM83_0856 [Gillisia sp. Hel_I_86]